jgi:hypothetical protein
VPDQVHGARCPGLLGPLASIHQLHGAVRKFGSAARPRAGTNARDPLSCRTHTCSRRTTRRGARAASCCSAATVPKRAISTMSAPPGAGVRSPRTRSS